MQRRRIRGVCHFPQILRRRNHCVGFTKGPGLCWRRRRPFGIQVDRVPSKATKIKGRRKGEAKKRRRRQNVRGGIKNCDCCIGISLVFPCVFTAKAIFPRGRYLHSRRSAGGHYKRDRCRLKYKTDGETSEERETVEKKIFK